MTITFLACTPWQDAWSRLEHHEDRTHLGLEKGTPDGRMRSVASGRVLAQERLGGLHHRYDRTA
jgi:hypothetical protein